MVLWLSPVAAEVVAKGLAQVLAGATAAGAAPIRGAVQAPAHPLGQRSKQFGIQIGGRCGVTGHGALLRTVSLGINGDKTATADEVEAGAELAGGQSGPAAAEKPGKSEEAQEERKQLWLFLDSTKYNKVCLAKKNCASSRNVFPLPTRRQHFTAIIFALNFLPFASTYFPPSLCIFQFSFIVYISSFFFHISFLSPFPCPLYLFFPNQAKQQYLILTFISTYFTSIFFFIFSLFNNIPPLHN